jgi:hypothetical protein
LRNPNARERAGMIATVSVLGASALGAAFYEQQGRREGRDLLIPPIPPPAVSSGPQRHGRCR